MVVQHHQSLPPLIQTQPLPLPCDVILHPIRLRLAHDRKCAPSCIFHEATGRLQIARNVMCPGNPPIGYFGLVLWLFCPEFSSYHVKGQGIVLSLKVPNPEDAVQSLDIAFGCIRLK